MRYAQPQDPHIVTRMIEIYINRKGITKTAFAKGIGCAPSQVTAWMSGTFYVMPMWACKIEKFTKGSIKAVDLILKNY